MKVHICTNNQIYSATLTLSQPQKQSKEITTDFSPLTFLDELNQTQCQNLTIPESLFNQEAMASTIYPPKLAASSNSVHSSDGSLISVFNTESQPSPSSTNYTQLETSFDLPVGDTSFIEQLLNQTNPSPSFADLDLEKELFDDFLKSDFDFTTDMTIDPTFNADAPVAAPASSNTFVESNETSSSYLADSLMNDETTSSPISHISEESETQPIHRRKRRKTTNNGQDETSTGRRLARFGNKQVIKYSDEYHDRRLKNNEAVKKSRMKAKEKQKTSEVQMSKLSEENRRLSDRLELLTKELQVLRSLYKDLKRDNVVSNNHV